MRSYFVKINFGGILIFVKLSILKLLLFLFLPVFPIDADESNEPKFAVYFSPKGGWTNAVVSSLDAAQSSILIQAYSFTSAPIAKALVNAKKHGVDVQAILDKSQKTEKYSSATFLSNARIPTFIDSKHKIAHNKIMIIDGRTVISG